ncbi:MULTISPECIES: hypothetical protein [Streptomyces]|uniref:Secreted protein n=1 Tax=Streptomyces flavotricini TaxID=66888 RepID=A0ABS8E8F0_9ACTN|nr:MULTISPECIES: hypothetical protein [Streptomyces]MCC0097238.1 hypothetical protein [Streptomyces flavotricini]WSI25238.1 hypothetical protein OG311_18690 [Streptomyces sp. NBC_01343]
MTKTQRMLAAFALAGAAAGLAAPAASAATPAPITLPDLPQAAPGMPQGATPGSVQEIGGKLNELDKLGRVTELPNDLAPVIAPVEPVLGLLGAVQ